LNTRGPTGFGLPELLVAITVLVIGVVAVAGLVVSTGSRTRAAAWQTDQIIAVQQELERVAATPFDSTVSTVDSTRTGLGSYTLTRTVSAIGPRLKRVDVGASGLGTTPPMWLTLVVVRPARLP